MKTKLIGNYKIIFSCSLHWNLIHWIYFKSFRKLSDEDQTSKLNEKNSFFANESNKKKISELENQTCLPPLQQQSVLNTSSCISGTSYKSSFEGMI